MEVSLNNETYLISLDTKNLTILESIILEKQSSELISIEYFESSMKLLNNWNFS